MKKTIVPFSMLLAVLLTVPVLAQTAKVVSECDRLAANPFDPNRPEEISGVGLAELNPDLAIRACERTLKRFPGNPRYQFQLARSFVKANRYAKALKFYRRAAAQGYAPAQRSLGVMYLYSQGVPQNDAEAVALFRKAAEQSNALAQNNLGAMYEKGRGVPQNEAAAARWFRKSAEQGYARAQANLARMYDRGQGVKQDYAKALKWYRRAAEQGDRKAQFNLGTMYLAGRGVPKDIDEAVKWRRSSFRQGPFADMQDAGHASIGPVSSNTQSASVQAGEIKIHSYSASATLGPYMPVYDDDQIREVKEIFVAVADEMKDGCLRWANTLPVVVRDDAERILRRSGITVADQAFELPGPKGAHILEIMLRGKESASRDGTKHFLRSPIYNCNISITLELHRWEKRKADTVFAARLGKRFWSVTGSKLSLQNLLQSLVGNGPRDFVTEATTHLAGEIATVRDK